MARRALLITLLRLNQRRLSHAVTPSPTDPGARRKFSRIQVVEGTAAAVFAAAILGTAGGVGWLVVALPNELQQLKTQVNQIVRNQDAFGARFHDLEKQVIEHDRRIIRLEIK